MTVEIVTIRKPAQQQHKVSIHVNRATDCDNCKAV